jgi:2-oxoglutarate dehydrogenase E1 component
MIEAPIFLVNGDDPEAALFVSRLALKYRQRFKKDVVIDLVCYRRHGHNEADEPAATQPIMYGKIRTQETTRKLYSDRLVERQVVTPAEVQKMQDAYRDRLDRGEPVPKSTLGMIGDEFTVDWSRFADAKWDDDVDTTISPKTVARLGRSISELPPDMKLHCSPRGPGQRPWHVLSSACGPSQPGEQPRIHAISASRRSSRRVSCHRFVAFGRGGSRFRVRLFDD